MGPVETFANKTVNLVFQLWPQPTPTAERLSQFKIVAHRGVHEDAFAKENTMEAFDRAVELGLFGIELDVCFTRDNVPVVCHDSTTERVFGGPIFRISDLNSHELRKVRPEVPFLSEVVTRFGKKVHLMIEIKPDLRGRTNLVTSIVSTLRALEPVKDFHLLTLEPEYLEAFHDLPKASFVDVIWLNAKRIINLNKRLDHGAIAGHFLLIKQSEIDLFHRHNKKVGVGFLDSRNSLYREINRGADWIFTNHPTRLKNSLRNRA